ncbi:MAG: rhamnogalacturonan acetylesterase [Pirellulales bacterium]|nr:rhamnogalacturonan acetylesterase [Pirellulales bacterium]
MNPSRPIRPWATACLAITAFILGSVLAQAEEKKPVRIVLIGDSTATNHAGWGGALKGFFSDDVKVINWAKSGRSSKSYMNEGHFKKALAEKPDYLFIQFGHNDCPGKGPKRQTDPKTTFKDNLKIYVAEARKIGAKPILITPMTRRKFDENGKIKSSLTPYAAAVREVGKETNTPVIDLHPKSIALFERLGDVGGAELQPKGDRSHFNAKGAKAIAGLIVEELPQADPELAKMLK